MRICLVSSEFPPFGGGGIGTYTWNMSRFLAQAGHEVHVVANAWVDYADRGLFTGDDIPNLTIHRIDGLSETYGPRPPYDGDESPVGKVCRWWDCSLYWSILVADELARLIPRHEIEVVEFPECFAEAYIAMRRRRLGHPALQTPMTLTLHSPIHEVTLYNLYRTYEGWFRRRTYAEEYCIRDADHLACPSRALAERVTARLGLDPDKHPCEVIPNPMDFEALPPAARGVIEEANRLLFVGRIEPRKGVKYLIDAAVRLMDRYPDLAVHLIGRDCDAGEEPGPMSEFLRRRIPASFQDRFHFEGLLPRAEVLRRYASATACVFPAPWDNFPYTCCEALAYGACVIASDQGGMAEMIENGRSGLLFAAGDVDSLAGTIEKALRDDDLRQRCRASAPAAIRRLCDPSAAVERRIHHYQHTIERFRSRPARHPSPEPVPRRRLAVFLHWDAPEGDLWATIGSVRTAAERAHLQAEVTVSMARDRHLLHHSPAEVQVRHLDRNDETAGIALWLAELEAHPPDYLMTLFPGEVLGSRYLELTRRILDENPQAAWATTWAESTHVPSQEPYAGFDFSVPLEVMFYHPVPFAVLRYSAYRRSGGWNLALPRGWRQWDLWLRLHQDGHEGIVAPEWDAKFIPYSGVKLDVPVHGKAHELRLETVARRNKELFGEYGVDLWIARSANPIVVHVPIPAPLPKPFWFRVVRFIKRRLGIYREPREQMPP